MSIHASINPEAEARFRAQRRNSTIASLIIGILLLLLMGLIFWAIAIPYFSKKTEPIVAFSVPPSTEDTIEKVKITTDVVKKPTQSSSATAVKVTVAKAATSTFSVPTVNTPNDTLAMDFGASDGFGQGWGASGMGSGGGSGGTFTLFGKTGGNGLVGNFYDLKQFPDEKATSLGEDYKSIKSIQQRLPIYANFIKEIAQDGFQKSDLEEYYQSPTALTFTNLMMDPKTAASEAPEAFQAPEVEPSGWVVVYEGRIDKPNKGSNKIKFVGTFDDYVMVYIDGKLVLNGACAAINTFGLKATTDIKSGARLRSNFTHKESDWITINNGTKIRIIVGESPGGHVGGGLFVEQKDVDYESDGAGGIKLPPFTTEPLDEASIERFRNMTDMRGQPFPIEVDNVPFFRATK